MLGLDEINEDVFGSAATDEELEAACWTQLMIPTLAYVTFCCPPTREARAHTRGQKTADGDRSPLSPSAHDEA